MKNKVKNRIIQEDEIDLISLVKTIWGGRKTIIKTTLIFMLLGLFVAIFSEKKYTASTTFVPQVSDDNIGGGLSGLAAMAGINLGGMSSGSEIPPALYPNIMNSIPFRRELLKTPLTFKGKPEKISFEVYYSSVYKPSLLGYIKKYTINLPKLILDKLKKKENNNGKQVENGVSIISISENENILIKKISEHISLDVNLEDGFVTISSSMPEALPSAELALATEELLQQYIINFKINKSKEQLQFIKERYVEVEKKFKEIQLKIADFEDKNKFTTNAKSKIEAQSMKDEYDLIYGVFNELAKQLETQYIKVTEDTPVFTVIEPVMVPVEKSKPRKLMVLVMYTVVGFIIGVGIIFSKIKILKLKSEWDGNSIL